MNKNLQAFLDTIAWAELGAQMQAESDRGYNVLCGSLPGKVKLFFPYSDHPRILVKINDKLSSTAAGRYQILKRTYDHYKKLLNLEGFWPEDQDKIAAQLIKERRAMQDIIDGKIISAIGKVRNIWASLPGAGYGQREHRIEPLLIAYRNAGGTYADRNSKDGAVLEQVV